MTEKKCKCGCRKIASVRSKKQFILGHWMRLKKHKNRVSKLLAPFKNKPMNKTTAIKISKTMKRLEINKLENNPSWRGNQVGYSGVHLWIHKNYGKANKCENLNCNIKSNFYEWANISGKYKRDRNDFLRLCRICHYNMDRKGIKPLLKIGD